MVNTLRRKKDKETPTVVDTNGHLNGDNNIAPLGSASISNSTPARAALQTPSSLTSVEDRSRAMAAPLQVRLISIIVSSHWLLWSQITRRMKRRIDEQTTVAPTRKLRFVHFGQMNRFNQRGASEVMLQCIWTFGSHKDWLNTMKL